MAPTTGDDFGIFKWMAGIAFSGIAGLIGGVWVTRGVLKDLEHNDADQNKRISSLEASRREQDDFCARQKTALIAELQKEICNIVRLAIKDLIIDHNKELGAISTNVAIQSKLMEQIQDDVAAIFERINRRSDDGAEQNHHRRT